VLGLFHMALDEMRDGDKDRPLRVNGEGHTLRATTLPSHAEHAEKFAPPHLSNPGHRNGENIAA
jgi:hypothetical protein